MVGKCWSSRTSGKSQSQWKTVNRTYYGTNIDDIMWVCARQKAWSAVEHSVVHHHHHQYHHSAADCRQLSSRLWPYKTISHIFTTICSQCLLASSKITVLREGTKVWGHRRYLENWRQPWRCSVNVPNNGSIAEVSEELINNNPSH